MKKNYGNDTMARKEKKLKNNTVTLKGELDENSSSKALTAEEVSEKYTVAELKSILKENGLKVSDKKQDLAERVLPILNEDVPNDSELKETADDEDLASPLDEQITSALNAFGMNYEELSIEDKTIIGDSTNLKIYGFTQNGLSMADFTMTLAAASDSSNVDLEMNIPEVSYTDFENTIFTFKNLDLSILPSSDPQSLEFSANLDNLEIITESNYVNLKGLNLFFQSLPDNGVRLDIDIDSFIFPDFSDSSINFENLGLSISLGVDRQPLGISVNLPMLTLLNKNYRISLSDLNINISLSDLQLSDLDLSILMPDFHYTNFDDVNIDMDNVDVSLEHTSDLNSVNVIIKFFFRIHFCCLSMKCSQC